MSKSNDRKPRQPRTLFDALFNELTFGIEVTEELTANAFIDDGKDGLDMLEISADVEVPNLTGESPEFEGFLLHSATDVIGLIERRILLGEFVTRTEDLRVET